MNVGCSIHNEWLVSRDDSDALIAAIERGSGNPRAGVFGPHSMSWRINRESALFLAAGRAALLQLAHPWVATAIEQHSRVMDQPVVRFHNTFRVVFAMLFGSVEQAAAAARHLYSVHTYIRGEMREDVAAYPRGSAYEANEIAALRWVYATLIESAVLAYECVMPPLTSEELAAYFDETKVLAALFGLPPEALPADWRAFLTYCRQMEDSNLLGVSQSARAMGQKILRGAGSWIKPPHWYRALTAEWLPYRFRREFGLEFGEPERRAARQARRWLPRVYRTLPRSVRFVGPWHEAQARLLGRRAGFVARWSNRFWIGQPLLPFHEA